MLIVAMAVTPAQADVGASSMSTGVIKLPLVSEAPPIDGDISRPQWSHAARISLGYNLRSKARPEDETSVFLESDGRYLYVGFYAAQRLPVRATQRTDDVGQNSDDQVSAYLWPNGSAGFRYSFTSTPLGTHYQQSSENTIYSPAWLSAGRVNARGYTVTMRIPLDSLRGSSSKTWRVQFARTIAESGDEFVWSHAAAQQYGQEDNLAFAGILTADLGRTAVRPLPRLGVYGLVEARSSAGGGSTSRMGLDLSIPIAPNVSFLSAIHPDYSNVELDQQTIAPTAYARALSEVRPFFTQGANFYDHFSCIGCPGVQELYSPAIPTPREGYAIEGKTGLISLAAFDAVGAGRLDTAQSLSYRSKDLQNNIIVQRVAVAKPGLIDDVTVVSATHDSLRGLFEYATYGTESGGRVANAASAKRREVGFGTYNRDGYLDFALRTIGAQYSPVDGFVQHPDIAGYDLNGSKTWYYPPTSRLKTIALFGEVDRYHAADGALNQSDTSVGLTVDTRSLWHLKLQVGSSYLRLADGTFTPISQNGFELHYRYHTASPSVVTYYTGQFGPGRLDSWTRSATMRIGLRGSLTVAANDDVQHFDVSGHNTEWLEKASFTYQSTRGSSLALGVRRVFGMAPVVATAVPAPLNAWNFTAAYYTRVPHGEVYVVYGDASSLATAHQLIVKFVQYVGGQKGT